jgi:hypothetical protein
MHKIEPKHQFNAQRSLITFLQIDYKPAQLLPHRLTFARCCFYLFLYFVEFFGRFKSTPEASGVCRIFTGQTHRVIHRFSG